MTMHTYSKEQYCLMYTLVFGNCKSVIGNVRFIHYFGIFSQRFNNKKKKYTSLSSSFILSGKKSSLAAYSSDFAEWGKRACVWTNEAYRGNSIKFFSILGKRECSVNDGRVYLWLESIGIRLNKCSVDQRDSIFSSFFFVKVHLSLFYCFL